MKLHEILLLIILIPILSIIWPALFDYKMLFELVNQENVSQTALDFIEEKIKFTV